MDLLVAVVCVLIVAGHSLDSQETEKKMDQLIFVSRVDRLSAKVPSLLTWHCLVSARRRGLDFREHGTDNQAGA